MTKAADDLLEFAAQGRNRPGPPCATCLLPERAVIDEARRNAGHRQIGGISVRRWLIAKCGYTEKTAPHDKAIAGHFSSGHHRETT